MDGSEKPGRHFLEEKKSLDQRKHPPGGIYLMIAHASGFIVVDYAYWGPSILLRGEKGCWVWRSGETRERKGFPVCWCPIEGFFSCLFFPARWHHLIHQFMLVYHVIDIYFSFIRPLLAFFPAGFFSFLGVFSFLFFYFSFLPSCVQLFRLLR